MGSSSRGQVVPSRIDNPYASPETEPSVAIAKAEAVRLSTHQQRIEWLGVWNVLCGLCGLLLTLTIAAIATNVSLLGALFWLAYWTTRTLAGAGMFQLKGWARWLGVGLHVFLTLSGVSSVVGLLGLWLLLSERGGEVFRHGGRLPDPARPASSPALLFLFTCLVLVNWAVPVWFFIFVLGPMV